MLPCRAAPSMPPRMQNMYIKIMFGTVNKTKHSGSAWPPTKARDGGLRIYGAGDVQLFLSLPFLGCAMRRGGTLFTIADTCMKLAHNSSGKQALERFCAFVYLQISGLRRWHNKTKSEKQFMGFFCANQLNFVINFGFNIAYLQFSVMVNICKANI